MKLALPLLCLLAASSLAQDAAPVPIRVDGVIRFGDQPENAYAADFFDGAPHDEALPSPDQLLGRRHGDFLARHSEILECLRVWADASPLAFLEPYGRTHEGRPLVSYTISSEANLARLNEILANHARLADPRTLSEEDAQTLIDSTPAIAWLGFSIHGDETSGSDAALSLAWHLTAATDERTRALRDELVIVLDPVLNPDGRERFLNLLTAHTGYVQNLDANSMHRGSWPYGRGNHYLFDLNRDWILGTHPETRGRWRVLRTLHPQLVVDAHEMGPMDTFLMYPQAAALNPQLPPRLAHWQRVFAGDHARAFDAQGWGYYTREWADGWFPGYTDAWGSLNGAIGMLYEQARFGGQPVRRESGEVVAYREAVHHQVTAALANLETLRVHQSEILIDQVNERARRAAPLPEDEPRRALLVDPTRHPRRTLHLMQALLAQGVEVQVATGAFQASGCENLYGSSAAQREFPAGTWIVARAQPLGALVDAFLLPTPPMDADYLAQERAGLERDGSTQVYDITAWNPALLSDLDAWWVNGFEAPALPAAEVANEVTHAIAGPGASAGAEGGVDFSATYAWIVPGQSDAALAFAARAMENELAVHLADEAFAIDGREFPRGSLLLRRHENPEDVEARLVRVLESLHVPVEVFAAGTGRASEEGADLGGGHFVLLHKPRVALLGNAPIDMEAYGHAWFVLDHELRMPHSILDASSLGYQDLRRFNVIVVPDGGGSLIAEHAESLAEWVAQGGTLIACGSAAGAAASEDAGLVSGVRLRRDVLEELDDWRLAAQREARLEGASVDPESVYGALPTSDTEENAQAPAYQAPGLRSEDAQEHDAWLRRFSPAGAIVRARPDAKHWLSASFEDEFAVLVGGSRSFVARPPATAAVRIAAADELRLGGLLWPEAVERLQDSAWAAVEGHGAGQVVLFAFNPAFRGLFPSGQRLFMNAVVYGPGAGASQPQDG